MAQSPRRPHAVIVSGIRVFPPRSGGQKRTAMIAKSLQDRGIDVTIFSLTNRRDSQEIPPFESNLPGQNGIIREIIAPGTVFTLAARIGFRLGLPPIWFLFLLKLVPPGGLKNLLQDADTIIADFPYVYSALRFGNGLKILSTHNVEHSLEATPLRRMVLRPLVRTIEIRAARCADHIICCSEKDAKFFRSLPEQNRKVQLLPNGIYPLPKIFTDENKAAARSTLGISENRLVGLFPASAYGPNGEGLQFLMNLSDEHGDEFERLNLEFHVVGSVSRSPRKLPGLMIHGPVEEIEVYFAAADFLVNPIFQGSGTSIKVAESIAARLPILTTEIGARGYFLIEQESAIYFSQQTAIEAIRLMAGLVRQFPAMAEKAWQDNRQAIDVSEPASVLANLISASANRRGGRP